jgi:hypothetical protein
MPKTTDTPRGLKPFVFHGVELSWSEGSTQAVADCPLCGASRKFYVNSQSGLWDCKVCMETGNPLEFLRKLFDASDKSTSNYEELAKDRGFLDTMTTLSMWGVCRSVVSGEWVVPGYDVQKRVHTLYRYVKLLKDGRWVGTLLPTPGVHPDGKAHGLLGLALWDDRKQTAWVCEGLWDGCVTWETMRYAKQADGGHLAPTANSSVSLLQDVNVVAVPGAGVMSEVWAPLFAGKKVVLPFDNDHPRMNTSTGQMTSGMAGLRGIQHAATVLCGAQQPPAEILYLAWGGEEGSTHDPELPDGYDMRDALMVGDDVPSRVHQLEVLSGMLRPVPDAWIQGVRSRPKGNQEAPVELLPCDSWKELVTQWKKSGIHLSEGLDRALSVMLASMVTTETVGDQVWVKVIGPPSCGKSTLCEALSTNREFTYPKDTLTRLTSGYQMDGAGSEDMSMVPKLRNKTLIINDGDTLLKLPNRDQILSQLRAFYGRNLRSQYGNKMSSDYEGVSTTIILCGTDALRAIDHSELGERFLDCVVADTIDEELEDEIAVRKAFQAEWEMSFKSNGRLDSTDSPHMVRAKLMTGGYVRHLRKNAIGLLNAVEFPEELLLRCTHLGKFIAFMRARPSDNRDLKGEREMSFRLVSQIVRLTKGLATVLNRPVVDEEVMRRARRVALDTARGRTLDMVHWLRKAHDTGLTTTQLALYTSHGHQDERRLVLFLRGIGVVEPCEPVKRVAGLSNQPVWKLTERVCKLYDEVMGQ